MWVMVNRTNIYCCCWFILGMQCIHPMTSCMLWQSAVRCQSLLLSFVLVLNVKDNLHVVCYRLVWCGSWPLRAFNSQSSSSYFPGQGCRRTVRCIHCQILWSWAGLCLSFFLMDIIGSLSSRAIIDSFSVLFFEHDPIWIDADSDQPLALFLYRYW